MSQEAEHHHPPPFDVPSVEEMAALLPQYSFEKLAAYGGMGAVYKAKQQSLDRPVAIKILPPEFGAEKEFAERFKSEARAMAKLNHTNIVGVYDFGVTTGGHLYLVMEWVQGHTLHEIIQKGCLPTRRTASLAMQLCDALAYAHTHQILHRDIKPGNIMVNEQDQVKVADFGLARPITGEAEENPYGTPDYAAPEILDKGAVDQRADIFAAGVVLYEMLTGRVPKRPRRTVTEFAPVSPLWDEVIDKAIHPEPAKRYQDALEFRAQISLLVNQAEQAAAVPVAVQVVDERGGRPRLKPLHLVLIITTVIVTGIFLGGLFRAEPEKKAKPRKVLVQEPAEEPAKKKKPKGGIAEKQKEPVIVMPANPPEPGPKVAEVAAPGEAMAAATQPNTNPAPPPMPAEPAAEDPTDAIQRLEERDPELARLIAAFENEWAVNDAIDTAPEIEDLAGKYIPALQRALAGLTPEQRDHVLSEISHVANHEPLEAPAASWPATLQSLRTAYDTQMDAIRATAKDAAEKMRVAQCELVRAKAKERAMAGRPDDAKLAEAVAEHLAKLQATPSLKALKASVGTGSGTTAAPPAAATISP